jgi:alpha-beta hydrolase superfamily lysophospholipase
MTDYQEEFLEGAGGLRIFLHSWHPVGKARAVILSSQGFNSHGGT